MDWNQIITDKIGRGTEAGKIARETAQIARTQSEDAALEYCNAQIAERLSKMAVRPSLADQPGRVHLLPPLNGQFETSAIEQIKNVARMPGYLAGGLLPDGHNGFSMPIGGWAALQDRLYPAGVGVDIGCSVVTSFFYMADNYIEPAIDAMLEVGRFGREDNAGNEQWGTILGAAIWDESPILRANKERATVQFGTSGGGNHFMDIMKVSGPPIFEGVQTFALVTHSGSRGVGAKVGQHFMKLAESIENLGGYSSLLLGTDEGEDYWDHLNTMGTYAIQGHRNMHARFYYALNGTGCHVPVNRVISGGERFGGVIDTTVPFMVNGVLKMSLLSTIETQHNMAWNVGNGVYLHGKGAIHAPPGTLATIPGTCLSTSYIVVGAEQHSKTYNMVGHGAGRPRSRTESKRQHNSAAWDALVNMARVKLFGVAPDETAFAYKPIEDVIDAQQGAISTIRTMRPVAVRMGGESDDGD